MSEADLPTLSYSVLEDCAWPDPDPDPNPNPDLNSDTNLCPIINPNESDNIQLKVDDVSRLSSVAVNRVLQPLNEQDVIHILHEAISRNKQVTMRGTQHSMGGHCTVLNGYVMDMRYVNHMRYNQQFDTVSVGTGCSWSDVIRFLDPLGRSPRTMQSYSTFSVGGTLSVNGHGITSDTTVAHDVVEFRLVRYCETETETESECETTSETATNKRQLHVQVVVCRRDSESSTERDLFAAALGGYGLFGVITEVTLRVCNNVSLELDSFSLSLTEEQDGSCEFARFWSACQQQTEVVNVKFGRLNLSSLDTALLYIYRKGTGNLTGLPLQERTFSKTRQLLYKWALPVLNETRFQREELSGEALDVSDSATRNVLVYESAKTLAKLYTPLFVVHDTFILQEFFVPRDNFTAWIKQSKPIYQEISDIQQNGTKDLQAQSLILLNTTIRFVEQDTVSLLSYSNHKHGSFAFVLYFRIKPSAERLLGEIHNRFAHLSMALGGSFYLPYRKCYDSSMLRQAYPHFDKFVAAKHKYDKYNVFSNQWHQQYFPAQSPTLVSPQLKDLSMTMPDEVRYLKSSAFQRRTDSFRRLVRHSGWRQRFREQFLTTIFNVADPDDVMRIMTKATWDSRLSNDIEIYRALHSHFQQPLRSTLTKVKAGFKGIMQLSHQKIEFTRQTATILNRVGLFGKVASYLSIGDNGKTVRGLLESNALDSNVQIYIAHDQNPEKLELAPTLERGSLNPFTQYFHFDYAKDHQIGNLASGTCDLITMNQGLHHIPEEQLPIFLGEVYRLLRPGGIFITREHNLETSSLSEEFSPSTCPAFVLDIAHSVFNAVTGVPPDEELTEIRAFRSLSEWNSILEYSGFTRCHLYEIEDGDCTADFMMCFSKGRLCGFIPDKVKSQSAPPRTCSSLLMKPPAIEEAFRMLMAQIPRSTAMGVSYLLKLLVENLPELHGAFKVIIGEIKLEFKSDALPFDVETAIGFVEKHVEFILNKITKIASATQDLSDTMKLREVSDIAKWLNIPELFLIMPFLQKKYMSEPEDMQPMEVATLDFVKKYLPFLIIDTEAHAAQVRVDDEKDNPDSLSDIVRSEEVEAVLLELAEVLPDLFEPSTLVRSGLTLTQQAALLRTLGSSDITGVAGEIAAYHNRDSWNELRYQLVGSGADSDCVKRRGDLPTKELLFSAELQHPWYRALVAFLSGPKVHVDRRTLVALQMIGMSELIKIYSCARDQACAHRPRVRDAGPEILNSLEKLLRFHSVRDAKIQFDIPEHQYDLYDVGVILKAEFGYVSLTSRLTNVTVNLQALQREVQRCRAGEKFDFEALGSLREDEIMSMPAGWLPLRELDLVKFRQSSAARLMADSFRKTIVTTGSLGFAGNNVLRIWYIPLDNRTVSSEDADDLCAQMRKRGHLHSYCRPEDGFWTFFKLSEWMQVDMIHRLSLSLNHTPWYFFPFAGTMKMYFDVLWKQCSMVADDYGFTTAYLSVAFLFNLVPGVVMGMIFAQLQLIGYPLKKALPLALEEDLVEEVIVLARLDRESPSPLSYFQGYVDARIRDVTLLVKQPLSGGRRYQKTKKPETPSLGVYRVMIPSYKTLGNVIVSLGRKLPEAVILQISNQSTILVKCCVACESRVDADATQEHLRFITNQIEAIAGASIAVSYHFPMDNGYLQQEGETLDRTANLAVKIDVRSLLTLVRLVDDLNGVEISQVFDFWSGRSGV